MFDYSFSTSPSTSFLPAMPATRRITRVEREKTAPRRPAINEIIEIADSEFGREVADFYSEVIVLKVFKQNERAESARLEFLRILKKLKAGAGPAIEEESTWWSWPVLCAKYKLTENAGEKLRGRLKRIRDKLQGSGDFRKGANGEGEYRVSAVKKHIDDVRFSDS
jgi:hypothetical protein